MTEVAIAQELRQRKMRRGVRTWLRNYGVSIASVLGILILWEIITLSFKVPVYILPAPTLVLTVLVDKAGLLFNYSLITAWEILLGYLLAVVVAVPLGFVIYYSRVLERIIYPFLVASQTIPKIAIAPLLVIWFGWGILPKVIVAFLIAFFPIVVDTVVGLKGTPPEMIYLVRSMGASQLQTFVKINLPNALPNIFGALKVASTLAVVGAIIGEFVAADAGIGYLLVVSQGYMDTPLMFAGIVALSALGLIFFFIIEFLERIFVPWRTEEKGVGRRATL